MDYNWYTRFLHLVRSCRDTFHVIATGVFQMNAPHDFHHYKASILLGALGLSRLLPPLGFGIVTSHRCHSIKAMARTDVRPQDVMGRRLAPLLGRATGVHP